MDLMDAASAQFESVVRRLPPDVWDRQTPCQLTVRELVAHVVAGNRLTGLLLTGVDRDTARATVVGDLLGADPFAAVVESASFQIRAFARTALDHPVAGPQGVVPAATYLRFRLIDLVVHAWDLLRAAGLDETLDPQITSTLQEMVEPHLPELLAYGVYGPGPSGVPVDSTPQATLLDWFGRRP